MNPFRQPPTLRIALHLVFAVFVVSLFVMAPSSASAQGSPHDADCTNTPKGKGKDIQCKVGTLMNKHEALLIKLEENAGNCSPEQKNCELMKKRLDRAKNALGRAKERHAKSKESDYDDLATPKKGKCKHGNCYDPGSGGELEVGDDDSELGAEFSDQLDELAQGLDTVTEVMSEPVGVTTAGLGSSGTLRSFTSSPAGIGGSTFDPLYDYLQDPDYPHWLHVGQDSKAMVAASFATSLAAGIAQGIAEVAERACEQVALGFNVSLACIGFEILAVALTETADFLDFVGDDSLGWDAHGAYRRSGQIYDGLARVDGNVTTFGVEITNNLTQLGTQVTTGVASVGDAVNNSTAIVNAGVLAVGGEVTKLQQHVTQLQTQLGQVEKKLEAQLGVADALQKHIIKLLLTPEGVRAVPASLFTCTGDSCPEVVMVCSAKTGLCTFNNK